MTAPPEQAPLSSAVLVGREELMGLTSDCFTSLGIGAEDAEAVADVLVAANLHGVPSHGFQRIPIFMKRVHAGLSGGTERMRVVAESGALCRMDAAFALGPAASVKALDRSLALAGEHGIGLVAVGRSTHFGAAGYYARRAAREGFVGVVISNAFKRMAPYGAAEVFLGTNPLAVGIPLAEHDPFVLDMATSIAAQGRITRARQLGEPIPAGQAIDPDGRPTTDAAQALAGSLLPVGGPKGSGLALAISLLSVLLAHADPDDQMGSLYRSFERPQNSGHVFIAIDGDRLGPGAASLDEVIERLIGLRPIEAAGAVEYPGQAGARLARARARDGIPIEAAELADLIKTCRGFGLEELARRVAALSGP